MISRTEWNKLREGATYTMTFRQNVRIGGALISRLNVRIEHVSKDDKGNIISLEGMYIDWVPPLITGIIRQADISAFTVKGV